MLQSQLEAKQEQLEALNATYLELAAKSITEYELDTAGDSQRGKRVSLTTLMKQIKGLEKDIENLQNRLYGAGIVRLHTNRY